MNKKRLSLVIGALAAAAAGAVWLFSFHVHKFSRPFSVKRRGKKISYVVCLKCAKEFRYDLQTLKVLERIDVNTVDIAGDSGAQ